MFKSLHWPALMTSSCVMSHSALLPSAILLVTALTASIIFGPRRSTTPVSETTPGVREAHWNRSNETHRPSPPPPHTPGEDEHLPHPPVLRLDLEWLSVGDAGFWLAHPPVSWNNSRTCGTGTKPPAAFARNPAAFAIEPWLSKVFVRRLYWKSLNAG